MTPVIPILAAVAGVVGLAFAIKKPKIPPAITQAAISSPPRLQPSNPTPTASAIVQAQSIVLSQGDSDGGVDQAGGPGEAFAEGFLDPGDEAAQRASLIARGDTFTKVDHDDPAAVAAGLVTNQTSSNVFENLGDAILENPFIPK